MTTIDAAAALARPKSAPNPVLRWVVGSMWGFWFLLLTVSMGLAAVIYYGWLRGIL
jgi:hypothetical protein